MEPTETCAWCTEVATHEVHLHPIDKHVEPTGPVGFCAEHVWDAAANRNFEVWSLHDVTRVRMLGVVPL